MNVHARHAGSSNKDVYVRSMVGVFVGGEVALKEISGTWIWMIFGHVMIGLP